MGKGIGGEGLSSGVGAAPEYLDFLGSLLTTAMVNWAK